MDILYIIGDNCSKCNYNELRYSLRSIETFGGNVGRVFVVGYCPDFLSEEVITVPCEDLYEDKEDHGARNANVLNKLLVAVDTTNIGDKFLVSFDDNYYIRATDFDSYPHYVRKNIPSLPRHKEKESAYHSALADARDFLLSMDLPTVNFATHRNIYCTRESIKANRNVLEKIVKEKIKCDRFVLLNNWQLKHHPFEFVLAEDVKLKNGGDWWRVNPLETECFSTEDFSSGIGLDCLLRGMFNKKSKYEK